MNISDIVHLNWTPNAGTEMAGEHYGVVLSFQNFNDNMPMVFVAPITSRYRELFEDFRVKTETFTQIVEGFICLDQIRSIDPAKRNFKLTDHKLIPRCKVECREILKKIMSF